MKHIESTAATDHQSYKPVKYWLATIAYRFWFTCLVAIAGYFWAHDGTALLIMCGVALLIDTIRNFKAPDLRVSVRDLYDQYHRAKEDDGALYPKSPKHYHRITNMIVFVLPATTVVIVAAVAPLLSNISPENIFLHEINVFASQFIEFIGLHVVKVISLGGTERVNLTIVVYLVNIVLFFCYIVYSLFGTAYYTEIYAMRKILHSPVKYPISGMKKYIFMHPLLNFYGLIAFYVFFVICTRYIYELGDSSHRFDYNIHESSVPFIVFSLILSVTAMVGCFVYPILLHVRMDAYGLWQKLAGEVLSSTRISGEKSNDQ